jgi:ribosomal protein S20
MALSTKVKIAAGVAVAVAVAGAGAAVAASQVWSPKAENQAVIDDAAKQLGISPDKLSSALENALKSRVDAAVAAGELTKDEGDALKARIDAGGAPFVLGGLGLRGAFGHGPFGGGPFMRGFSAAAGYLGLSESELRTQLASGKTLAEIAEDQGKSVDGLVQALVKDAEAKIDAAVSSGRLTKDQGGKAKSTLEQTVTELVNGKLSGDGFRAGPMRGGPFFGPPGGFGFHRFGPGQGFRRHAGSPPASSSGPSA